MLLLRSVVFTILVPGAVVVWLPFAFILPSSAISGLTWTPAAYGGLFLMSIGGAVMLWCIGDFMIAGGGTLAPFDPPTLLVGNGLYRYLRNPMYGGVLLVLLGEAAVFRSSGMLTYTGVWFVIINLVVVLYEEPTLRRRFGASYDRYCESVDRWWPRQPRSR